MKKNTILESFILNYTIDNDEITVNVASGNSYTLPYTEENEKHIIKTMEKQSIESINMEKEILAKYVSNVKLIGLAGASVTLSFALLASGVIPLVAVGYATVGGTALSVLGYNNAKKNKKVLEDINKNKLFLANKKIINKNIDNIKNNVDSLDERAKYLVENIEKEQQLNINDIKEIDYNELKDIVKSVEPEEVKVKTLTRKKY
jgi:hypothetical protein